MNKKLISSLLGGGVITIVASFGGVKLSDKISYDKKIKYYGELNKAFSKDAPKEFGESNLYMPKWEDDERWKKLHKRDRGHVNGKGVLATYQEMRDICYELVKNKAFDSCTSASETWCSDCTLYEKRSKK